MNGFKINACQFIPLHGRNRMTFVCFCIFVSYMFPWSFVVTGMVWSLANGNMANLQSILFRRHLISFDLNNLFQVLPPVVDGAVFEHLPTASRRLKELFGGRRSCKQSTNSLLVSPRRH